MGQVSVHISGEWKQQRIQTGFLLEIVDILVLKGFLRIWLCQPHTFTLNKRLLVCLGTRCRGRAGRAIVLSNHVTRQSSSSISFVILSPWLVPEGILTQVGDVMQLPYNRSNQRFQKKAEPPIMGMW